MITIDELCAFADAMDALRAKQEQEAGEKSAK